MKNRENIRPTETNALLHQKKEFAIVSRVVVDFINQLVLFQVFARGISKFKLDSNQRESDCYQFKKKPPNSTFCDNSLIDYFLLHLDKSILWIELMPFLRNSSNFRNSLQKKKQEKVLLRGNCS